MAVPTLAHPCPHDHFYSIVQHINGSEPLAVKRAYLDCRNGENPIHWGVFVSDQDSSSAAAVKAAGEECGEERASDWQYCFFHVAKGNHRRLNQKLSSKVPVEVPIESSPVPVDPEKPYACPRCGKNFKTSSGRSIHQHSCKVTPSTPLTKKGTAVPMEELCRVNGILSKESKPYQKKIVHWFMLRKMAELRNGVRDYARFRCYNSPNDLELKGRLRRAAATILPCLSGDHSSCSFSFVCKDAIDPYRKALPLQRNIPIIPKSVQILLRGNVWDMFSSAKLDALVRNASIRTTSRVESLHRTIRNSAPKSKPLFRNETPVLKMGAAIAANRGKGKATLRHLQSLGVPITSYMATRLQRIDRWARQHTEYRKSDEYKLKERDRRRKKFISHASSLASEERLSYRKESFEHTYARQPSRHFLEYL